MKKNLLVIALVVAVMALVAPVLALAGNSDTTTVTGSLGVTFEVTAPSDISFGNLTAGWNTASSATPGSVTTNATNWTVTAIDQNTGDHKGCMLSGANYLAGEFQISSDGSSYSGAATNGGITYTNSTTLPLYVKQYVNMSDKAGIYTITIVFTASAS